MVVDISPQQTLDEPMEGADGDLQRMLGEMMRQQRWQEDDLRAEGGDPITLAEIARVLAAVLLALVLAAYAVKLYRAQVPRFADPRQLYRVGYRAVLDRLADIGLRRRYGESRERFAQRARSLSPAFIALTEEHLQAALGSRRSADGDHLRRLMHEVSAELRRQVPGWRRLLGVANPVSWLSAR